MFNQVIVVFSLVLILISSCDSPSQLVNNTEINIESKFKTVTAEEICSIEIPKYFWEMSDLNSEALIQYGYNDTIVDSTSIIEQDAIYVTTSVFYKMDLQKILGDSVRFDLLEFNNDFVENLKLALDDARAEYEIPNIN